jgi:D-arabinose 1-dehydrogenase-like Zn-dependent alcohol dehydrogenase
MNRKPQIDDRSSAHVSIHVCARGRQGRHVLRGRYGFAPEFPVVGGHMECVGTVEALGPDTAGPKVGERVVDVAVPAVPGPAVSGTWQ